MLPVAGFYESRFVMKIEVFLTDLVFYWLPCSSLLKPLVSIFNYISLDTPHSGFSGLHTSVAPPSCLGITNGTTDNDLMNGVCKNLPLVFARGTTENGNVGDIVGPPFVHALVSMLGEAQVAVQGVNNYPSDVQDFLAGGSVTGSQKMTQCPVTKLCVSGYS